MVQGSSSKSKAPIVDYEDQGIWKKVQANEYFFIDQLSITHIPNINPGTIKIFQNSSECPLKVLGEAYVPSSITHWEVAPMVGQVFEANKISFHKYELPLEGTTHNKALYISIQYQDKVITKALVI